MYGIHFLFPIPYIASKRGDNAFLVFNMLTDPESRKGQLEHLITFRLKRKAMPH
jgi:hypothetical protein